MADNSAPLRNLTEKDVEWKLTEMEENSFDTLKKLATGAQVLRFYDPTLPLTLSVDSSSTDLGRVLMQERQPVAYGSRTLIQNTAELRTDRERDTSRGVRMREYGRTVEEEAFHKPHQSIFNKLLHQASERLQHFLLQLQKYDLRVTYK